MTAALDLFAAELGPLRLPRQFVPVDPTAKQEFFLRRNELEVFFGGAAGPGKSTGLLMAGSQYVDVGGYKALILRTTLQDHDRALIPVSHDWFGGTGAAWNGSLRRWAFPSGATVEFGYVRTVADLAHWKGLEYAFVGFDELTEFDGAVYSHMSRVLRAPPKLHDGTSVPLRKRAASNPGGRSHGYVKTRFIDPRTRDPKAVSIRASIRDNPHIDIDEYLLSLDHMSLTDRMRLINGDWDVTEEGGKFRREKFGEVEPGAVLDKVVKACRYWDLAGSEPSESNPDPDYTVGVLLGVDAQGMFTVLDIVRGRWADADVENAVKAAAHADRARLPNVAVHTFVEQDPGQAGKAQVSHYKRIVLQGFPAHAGSTRINGVNAAKLVRAATVAAAVDNGLYRIVPNTHLLDFLDEVAIFPNGAHDDCVDALSGAHNHLTTRVTGGQKHSGLSRPRGRIPGVDSRTVNRR